MAKRRAKLTAKVQAGALRQSLQIEEVKAYRSELHDTYANWESSGSTNRLLKFLAATISVDDILDGAIKVASGYHALPTALVEQVLSWSELDSRDMDLWVPHVALLEDLQAWGLLKFKLEQDNPSEVRMHVEHQAICSELLAKLKARNRVET